MKTISYDGVAAVTTDEVADAMLAFAIAVARFNQYEDVTIPVLVAGAHERLTVMLGPTIHISALTVSDVEETELGDAAEVAASIRDRTRDITDPLHRDAWAVAQR